MLTTLIIAALAAAIAGGAASGKVDVFAEISKFWRRQIKKHIEDEEKAAELNAFWDQVEAEFQAFQDSVFAGVGALGDVHRNYDSVLEDYLERIDAIATKVKEHQDRIMDLGYEFAELLDPDLYEQISAEMREEAAKRKAKDDKKEAKKARKAAKKAE